MKLILTKSWFWFVKRVLSIRVVFLSFWAFLLMVSCFKNRAPEKPIITGPNTALKNDTVYIKVFSLDPEDNNICYLVEWGDTSKPQWSPFFPSGETVTRKHIYTDEGEYFIRAKARDVERAESPWSEEFKLEIK